MPPEPLGIIRKKDDVINIAGYGIGDRHAKALSSGIKSIPKLRKLKLRNNRLSDTGSKKILSTLTFDNLVKMDLSENTLGI